MRIASVELLENGKSISKDAHGAWSAKTGNTNGVYVLESPEPAFGTKYSVRVSVSGWKTNDSRGDIYLKKED